MVCLGVGEGEGQGVSFSNDMDIGPLHDPVKFETARLPCSNLHISDGKTTCAVWPGTSRPIGRGGCISNPEERLQLGDQTFTINWSQTSPTTDDCISGNITALEKVDREASLEISKQDF